MNIKFQDPAKNNTTYHKCYIYSAVEDHKTNKKHKKYITTKIRGKKRSNEVVN